jgi:segregation and condensation protein B
MTALDVWPLYHQTTLACNQERSKTVEPQALIESLLFVADQPVELQDLATALNVDLDAIEEALQALEKQYQTRGIRLQRKRNQVQLVSAPEAGPTIELFLGLERSGKLSVAAMEALSIVAYLQPVTRIQVEAIRGVHSDGVLRSLVRRGLIEAIGRAETVGRPILFATTFEFLQQFGLESLSDLPAREELTNALSARENSQANEGTEDD